ncbi:hypothetical protein CI109_104129 [Kwoniella shandongensis]|uniref:Uncharacterized protein n=1 Tax=Kwoniella shandongensis TaxID=1734106 RepID=A0A5M6C0Y1_9TREE|nr:uncharacterized protein CI109_002958 [Kwoniella shandongensis]KAA5528798.1 hypothetical protein CI109_002958 [Kwoniella shandongensis]
MSSLLEESHPVEPPSISSLSLDTPPIPSFQLRQPICGIETELLIQTFDDRILVIVTQNGKVGCLTQASLPPHTPLPPPPRPATSTPSSTADPSSTYQILSILPSPPPSLTLTPLLGSPPNQTLHELYVSQIATLIFWALETSGLSRRGVVVGLSLSKIKRGEDDGDALSDGERERFAGIMEMVSHWSGAEI